MSRRKNIETFMRNFTSFGDTFVAFIVVAIGTQDMDVVIRVALGLLLIYLIGGFIKSILFKESPAKSILMGIFRKVESGSFPSLHVARSSFAYGFLLEYLDFPFTAIPVILVLLVAFSRVFLKKHYIVDTIFGLFFGLTMFYVFKIVS